ncbi:hypothetical protein DP124_02170 [Clostridium tetani]|nr:hypothetical protein DP122_07670 [Clostridium tetani]RXI55697.1 hypothetical protein DP124_02170 [Clostridium tetani]RXI77636.1 hypothetical protein DP128_01970 [Clostridium tetani]RXM57393.1 hypothetical protein DP133_09790 [Clostridium tetani]RXM70605.1 hypothetical protein DP139_06370 [Clostridium tetani]
MLKLRRKMKNKFKILDKINVTVEVIHNEYDFLLNKLFLMAARKNPKRVFLFVSTVLGKHIPVNPKKSILIGALLANKMVNNIDNGNLDTKLIVQALKDDKYIQKAWEYINDNPIMCNKSTLFIGFAETATALGNSVFATFLGENIKYIHTTRDMLKECRSVFSFDEEHSHAVEHFCYPIGYENFINEFERIVLVDDEITTGNTVLNLIKSINSKYPGKEYVVISILDWRSKECINKFEQLKKQLNIKIETISLIQGQVSCENNYLLEEKNIYQNSNKVHEFSKEIEVLDFHIRLDNRYKKFTRILNCGDEKQYQYLMDTGRFGINSEDVKTIEKIIEKEVKNMGEFEKDILVLGTGEFMYLPMILASKIPNAKYQSTTRSPVYSKKEIDYGIKCAETFKNPFDKSIINYLYNVEKGIYKEILFVTEREIDKESREEIIQLFQKLEVNKVRFIYF